jgi:preprotein translocase subunit SecF
VIHDFALALLMGVIVGTYSSIFVASPIVYLWPWKKAKGRIVKVTNKTNNKKVK